MMESNNNNKDKVNSNGSTNGNNSNNSNNNDSMLDKQLLHKILDLCKSPKVPDKATLRYEYVKVKVKCKGEGEVRVKVYGPYLYAYWRENGKLKKRYMGKSINDYMLRVLAYEYDVDANFLREYRIMKWLAEQLLLT